MNTIGKLYGVGVGPGDPELLTRKAARILGEVDWIFMPAPSAFTPGFAARIIAALQLDSSRFRPVQLCMSRQRDAALATYDGAAEEILSELRRGRSAAWITEGDPLFFSTFMHVWSALRSRAPELAIEIVPGITSMGAAAACAGLPVASFDESVVIIPAAYGISDLSALLERFTTVFLIKVHKVFDQLLDKLSSLPCPIQAIYVEKVGTAEERVVRDLTSLRGQPIPYFSLVILRSSKGGRA